MISPDRIKWGGAGWMLVGVAWVVLTINAVSGGSYPAPPAGIHNALSSVLSIAVMLLSMVGLVGLHTLQRGSYGRLGRAGFRIALVAFAAQALGFTVFLLSFSMPAGAYAPFLVLGGMGFTTGLVGAAVGLTFLGFATVRARVMPGWYGVALVVALPLRDALMPRAGHGVYGGILVGLLWMVLGYVLWSRREDAPVGGSTTTREGGEHV